MAAKFVQLADAPAIFGDSPEAGIVLFAASDSAWKTAADALGECSRCCRCGLCRCHLCSHHVQVCNKSLGSLVAGISIDPLTASKADGEKLGSIMMYNMISGAGADVHSEGSPAGLAAKQEIQTLLGAANSQQLPLRFSQQGSQVRDCVRLPSCLMSRC